MIQGRGQVAIMLIFVVALILVVGTLFSFYGFSRNSGNSGQDWNSLMSNLNFAHNYVLAESKLLGENAINCKNCKSSDLKGKLQELSSERNIEYGGAGNFFVVVKHGEFTFSKSNGDYLLKFTPVLFVQSNVNGNYARENFTLEVEFDSNGQFKRFINN